MKRIFTRRGYIFTDRKNPRNGVLSFLLGVIALSSVAIAVELTYQNDGQALVQYGMAVILSIIYSIVGLVLGIRSLQEKDIFRLFPILGIILNALTLIAGTVIIYFGIS
jgi:hypothetical protein